MSKASTTNLRDKVGFIDQPTTLRAKIDHDRKVKPTLPHADGGDIDDPGLVKRIDRKLLTKTIRAMIDAQRFFQLPCSCIQPRFY